MSSNAPAEQMLDLDRDLPVTREDVEAQRRLRADLPHWFTLDASEPNLLSGGDALDRRPLARDAWKPFSLE